MTPSKELNLVAIPTRTAPPPPTPPLLSMATDSVACLLESCTTTITKHSQALQCDVCNKWAHTDCVGVTKQAYKLAGKLEGFQWFCPKCLDNWKSVKPTVSELASELTALRIEVSKVPSWSKL